jgi:glycosyltransferase involved in cell wall biosynthesis
VRIVHAGPTTLPVLSELGGAVQRRIVEVATCQVELGHQVTVFSTEAARRGYLHRGIAIEPIRATLPRPWRDYEVLAKLRRRLRDRDADVVHFHGVPDGARWLRGLGFPTVLSVDYFRFRFSGSSIGRRYRRRSLERFDVIAPVSNACSEELQQFWRLSTPRVVVPNGVNVGQFHPMPEAGAAIRRELAVDGCLVLYVGRLCEQKGTGVLLEAWERMGPRTDATLVLAGPVGQFGATPRSSELLDRVERLQVRYLGPVHETRLSALYNAADLFVMPTVRDEMFGMAALEAESCGRPVVASRLGGLVEAVGPDCGLFVDPDDPAALADALGSLIDDPDLRDRLGAAGPTHARRFEWSKIAQEYLAIYERLGQATR